MILGKLKSLKRLILTTEIRLRTPTSRCVIVDNYRSNLCLKLAKQKGYSGDQCSICYLRNELVYLDSLILSVIGKLFLGFKLGSYVEAFIRLSKCKSVISYIDDSPSIYVVASRIENVNFFVYQNGWRWLETIQMIGDYLQKYNISNISNLQLHLYGHSIWKMILQEWGDIEIKYVISGSMLNNFSPRLSEASGLKKQKVLYISQFRKSNSIPVKNKFLSFDEFYLCEFLYLKVVKSAVLKLGMEFKILLTNSWQKGFTSIEKKFYTDILGESSFLSSKNSYNETDMYNFCVTFDSTLGIEAAARGNKVAFLDYRLFNFDELRESLTSLSLDRIKAAQIAAYLPSNTEQVIRNVASLSVSEYNKIWNEAFGEEIITFEPFFDC